MNASFYFLNCRRFVNLEEDGSQVVQKFQADGRHVKPAPLRKNNIHYLGQDFEILSTFLHLQIFQQIK